MDRFAISESISSMRRKKIADVRDGIRLVMRHASEDVKSDIEYCKLTGRGRLLGLEILCAILGFEELEKEIKKILDDAIHAEQKVLRDKIGR